MSSGTRSKARAVWMRGRRAATRLGVATALVALPGCWPLEGAIGEGPHSTTHRHQRSLSPEISPANLNV